jgi:antitoxin component of RelBE/YafQ-DinJ toxin-antitoxin module
MGVAPETSVTVRLSADEHRFAVALAEVDGISVSDAVRMSITRAYEARFGQQR